MSQIVSRHTQQPGRVIRMPVLRRSAVASYAMRLGSRTALMDIGNRVTEPKAQGATRNPAMDGGCGREPSGRPVRSTSKANKVARKEGESRSHGGGAAASPGAEAENRSHEGYAAASPGAKARTPPATVAEDNDPEYSHNYAKDICQYLRDLEENQPIRPKYLTGQEINGKMRAVLIDWLVQVQDNAVSKKKLQLVGVTAMFIASKYEELYPLCTADLIYVTDDNYTTSQMIQMGVQILQALDFRLSHPLASQFLNMALEVAKVNTRQHVLAKYLMELSIVDYDMVHFPPSKTATAASCLSLKLLKGCKWTQTLQHRTSYTENDLLPVMQHIAKNVVLVNKITTKEKAIKRKYASSKTTKISTTEQLNSPVIWDLAWSVNKKL